MFQNRGKREHAGIMFGVGKRLTQSKAGIILHGQCEVRTWVQWIGEKAPERER
jgi:hypothetical protein